MRVGAFGEVNVEWRLFGDTSGDFTQTQGVVTFPDQVDSVDLELPAARDDILEPDESFQVRPSVLYRLILIVLTGYYTVLFIQHLFLWYNVLIPAQILNICYFPV